MEQAPGELASQLQGQWMGLGAEARRSRVPLICGALGKLDRHSRNQRPYHALQSTAPAHEAHLRLANQEKMSFDNRTYFFAVAARVMRQILRKKQAVKRGPEMTLVVDKAAARVNLVVRDDALKELSFPDARQGQIVGLRLFAGLLIEEVSENLYVSPAMVKREWTAARLRLRNLMARQSLA